MAILEFEFKGIDQNFRSSAANVLKDIDKIKSAFGGIGGGSVDVSGLKKGMDEVRASIKLAESDNKMFLATKLADTRQASIEELNAIRSAETQKQQAYRTTGEAWKAQREQEKNIGVGLDNSFKETRNSIAKLNEEQKRYNATQRETRDALKAVSSERPYTQLTAEMNRVRKEAQDLGAQMIRLEMAGDTTSKKYIQLATAFKTAQQSLNPLDAGVKKLDGTLGQHQRNVGNYQQAQSGANGVAMEFNRIIQDAPFGMMGIGNNIQQLTANWQHYTTQVREAAQANGTVVTNASLMRGALSALISPANLLTLGIAAITSAWTWYTMSQQKANKATKESKEATEDFRKSLDTLSRVQLETATNANKDLTRLKMLSTVYKDNASSIKQRELALNGITNIYKNYFPNLSTEQAKIEALSGKYAKLTEEILRTSRARGYEQILADKQTDNINSLAKQSSARNNINKAIDEYRREVEKGGKKLNKTNEELFSQFYDQLNTKGVKPLTEMPENANSFIKASVGVYQAILKYNGLQRNSITTQQSYNEIFQQYLKDVKDGKISIEEFNTKLEEAKGSDSLGKSLKNTSSNLKEAYDYLSQIRDLISGKQKDIDLINVDGQTKDLIELEYKWEGYFNKLKDLENKAKKDKSLPSTEKDKVIEGLNKANVIGDELLLSEQSEILKKYQDIRLEIIRKANEEAGIFEQQSRETDLAKQKIWLDEKLKELVKNGAQIKQAMEGMLPADLMRTYDINIKWDNKDLEEWGKLNDKIQETIDKPFSGQNSKSIQSELEKRIGILKKLLEQLARATGQPFDQAEFDKMSKEMKDNASNQKDDKKLEKDIQDYTNILKTGVDNVFTNLKTNIDEFGWKAESVFYSLGETVGDMLKQVANKNTAKFMEKLTEGAKDFKGLADNFSDMWKKDKGLVIGAGLGMAGSGVSQLTNKTDVAGQAVGGALSGAGSMVATGNPYLIAAGAVVGGLTSALNAAKTKKQERIALKQLEEQKKANALLERMSALTYASQIIGQKTEYGIVSGVRRNEFGQIVSVVQGQDIIMVADRANNKKQR